MYFEGMGVIRFFCSMRTLTWEISKFRCGGDGSVVDDSMDNANINRPAFTNRGNTYLKNLLAIYSLHETWIASRGYAFWSHLSRSSTKESELGNRGHRCEDASKS